MKGPNEGAQKCRRRGWFSQKGGDECGKKVVDEVEETPANGCSGGQEGWGNARMPGEKKELHGNRKGHFREKKRCSGGRGKKKNNCVKRIAAGNQARKERGLAKRGQRFIKKGVGGELHDIIAGPKKT